ncbi:MAG TPA: SpvB/TcaC N-terminal domain-containing protein, partial [Flavisolibacter sp.]|nr:SpvB/TcaC N-terminal domain-containing protein [Flavisolibacter sp.]
MKSLPFRPLALLALTFCFAGFVHPPIPDPTFPAFWKYINNRLYKADRSRPDLARDNTLVVNGPVLKQFVNMRAQPSPALDGSLITVPHDPGTFSKSGFFYSPHASRFFYLGTDSKPLRVEKWAGFAVTNMSLLGARLHIPEGAIESARLISITALRTADVPALDPGLVNVTKDYAGYRFLPHGSQFRKAVQVSLAYDETKIPRGYTANDVVSFFFDETTRHWVPLQRDSVDVAGKRILSTTTHFTDMINGVLEVPEAPSTLAYTPNTMSGITYPDAASEIVLIDAPTANNSGSAVLSYPIKLPAGRNGMEPSLAVQYNSDGGSTWMGLGWDLAVSAVSIETRWGVPRYNATQETETYTIDGGQLAPVAHRSDPVNRTSEKQFYPRVNTEFQKIIRHGSNPKNYWWEVTGKDGNRQFYGGDPRNGPDAAAVLTDASGNVAYWALTEGRDPNENFVKYR